MAGAHVLNLVLFTPGGVIPGDLLIAFIALTYSPSNAGVSGACPGAAPIITPPVGWASVLLDYPGGDNALGDMGDGEECDRLGVYVRRVTATEPVTHTFDWTAGGVVSAIGVIKSFWQPTLGEFPDVDVAAAAATKLANVGGTPMNVRAPTVTPLGWDRLLVCCFVARVEQGLSPFSIPAGMMDMTPAINGSTAGGAPGPGEPDPLGMAIFIEALADMAATGTRTSVCNWTSTGETPASYKGMGYSLCVRTCGIPDGDPRPGPA